jgi:hypothetical protein
VAIQPTVPVRDWSPEQRKAVERKAIENLEGVGDMSAEHWQMGSLALHYRRPMTVAEAMKLPPPVRTTPAENRAAWARLYALETIGLIRGEDVEETTRTQP